MSYVFQSTLHRTSQQAHRAIAGEWLSAGGNNKQADIKQALLDYSDDQLADEAIAGWGLTERNEYDEPELDWFDRDELVAAFCYIRTDPSEAFGWDD
ncbi:MAG: hypothetical protein H7842_02525 [Gammaproteobacteria bacterium SHHR-1]